MSVICPLTLNFDYVNLKLHGQRSSVDARGIAVGDFKRTAARRSLCRQRRGRRGAGVYLIGTAVYWLSEFQYFTLLQL